MEIKNFPENPRFEKRPEVVHYVGEERREAEPVLRAAELPVSASPAPVFSPSQQIVTEALNKTHEISRTDAEVSEIMRLAAERGVEAAVKEVRNDDPAVIDAVHDKLVEELASEYRSE